MSVDGYFMDLFSLLEHLSNEFRVTGKQIDNIVIQNRFPEGMLGVLDQLLTWILAGSEIIALKIEV